MRRDTRIPRAWRAITIVALALWPAATTAHAQFRDARLPESGRLWFEVTPTLLNWSDQFALGSADGTIPDGSREPLFAHFDGPLAARLFPGPEFLIDALNSDAAALGFDPVSTDDFSLGNLDFSSMRAQVRRLALGFELGILDRFSVGFKAPFTLTDMSTSFVFDSTTASVTGASAALPAGGQFFIDAGASLGSLQALIDGGTLTGPDLTGAIALRDDTDAFLSALDRRSTEDELIPTAPSTAGMQMLQRFTGFQAAFEALGLSLPELLLPESATGTDLSVLFGQPPLSLSQPRNTRNALGLGEVEVSARFNLFDGITRRRRQAASESVETGPSEPADPGAGETEPGDPAADPGAAAGEPASSDDASGIRFRTSVGILARIPIRPAGSPPFANPAHPVDIPIGDGQTDIELSLYQDIALGGWFVIRSALRYGIQRPDQLILRVGPPDRPYVLESTQAIVERDLGDYLSLVVRPSARINSALSFSLEYDYFRLGDPAYTLLDTLPDVADAGPLGAEGSMTRHRVGVGFIFDMSEAQGTGDLLSGTRPVRRPWQFGISMRRAISGSGGLTPASFRFGAEFRVPIDVF